MSLDRHRVDRRATVVGRGHKFDFNGTGLFIDFTFSNLGSKAESRGYQTFIAWRVGAVADNRFTAFGPLCHSHGFAKRDGAIGAVGGIDITVPTTQIVNDVEIKF